MQPPQQNWTDAALGRRAGWYLEHGWTLTDTRRVMRDVFPDLDPARVDAAALEAQRGLRTARTLEDPAFTGTIQQAARSTPIPSPTVVIDVTFVVDLDVGGEAQSHARFVLPTSATMDDILGEAAAAVSRQEKPSDRGTVRGGTLEIVGPVRFGPTA